MPSGVWHPVSATWGNCLTQPNGTFGPRWCHPGQNINSLHTSTQHWQLPCHSQQGIRTCPGKDGGLKFVVTDDSYQSTAFPRWLPVPDYGCTWLYCIWLRQIYSRINLTCIMFCYIFVCILSICICVSISLHNTWSWNLNCAPCISVFIFEPGSIPARLFFFSFPFPWLI